MKKPDFKDLKTMIKAVKDADTVFKHIYEDRALQEKNIGTLCNKVAGNAARKDLYNISTEELKNARAGIRVQALIDAGFATLGDIGNATDYQLRAVPGIGEKQTETIRNLVTEFANSLAAKTGIVLDGQLGLKDTTGNTELITELAAYLACEAFRRENSEAASNLSAYAQRIADSRIIKNGVHWLFSSAASKQNTVMMSNNIHEFVSSSFFGRMLGLIDIYQAASHISSTEALAAFAKNSADFYAVLENLGNNSGNRPFIYDNIPLQLAQDIDSSDIDLSGFTGNLRAYQAFGAKYILHQKKVLLGDEMGLGKTIQAIAAMSHIQTASDKRCYFLIVCPASVLINWARELKKFSHIDSFILHGGPLEDSFNRWQENGGAAITNYETMGKIVDGIDNHMTLSMLVIDEAHYMKNPDAKRTMYIRRLDNESERILLMTGTPLENRVEEMCNLIDFVRPDMTKEVRSLAHISYLPEFKEALAPVYIRRTRNQVLKELPPIEQKQQWCALSDADKTAYAEAVMGGNFSDMRRVSFLQDDITASAKCVRLKELLQQAEDEGRKVVIYSFFRETISKVSGILGDKCVGVISGDTKVDSRQLLVDRFNDAPAGSALVSQIVAGGVGLNIQAASIVVFCEPQIKPSLEMQALSRVYRMGQVRNVLVYHLLCPDTVDEEMISLLESKQIEFDNFADESAVACAYDNIIDTSWIGGVIEKQKSLWGDGKK